MRRLGVLCFFVISLSASPVSASEALVAVGTVDLALASVGFSVPLSPVPSPGEAAGAKSTLRQRHIGGGILVGVGLTVQTANVINAVLSVFDVGHEGVLVGLPLVSIPFAPLTAIGFREALTDGSPRGTMRSAGIGLLEGGCYAALVAGVFAINFLSTYDVASGAVVAAFVVPHAATAVGLLIPGIICLAVSKHLSQDEALGKVRIVPTIGPTSMGVHGRF